MAAIPAPDGVFLDECFGMKDGYVLDFTNRSLADFVRRDTGEEIEDPQYSIRGSSKANRLRCFLDICDDQQAARILRSLWMYREDKGWTPGDLVERHPDKIRHRFLGIVEALERKADASLIDAVEQFSNGLALEELIAAIGRDIAADKHAAALDRLHTYCMKRFAYLLAANGVSCEKEEPLQSRVGKYVKHVTASRVLRAMSVQILKNSMGILQGFNDIRNNGSFAHDNDILLADESRFIFDTVVSILRFVGAIERGELEAIPDDHRSGGTARSSTGTKP